MINSFTRSFYLFTFVLISFNLLGQDSSLVIKEHSPKKATIMSAVLPGLGQAYNKKYWKVPIIYAAAGTSIYLAIDNNKNYKLFRQEYLNKTDDDPTTIDNFPGIDESVLLDEVNYYRRSRDLSIIITSAIYILNVVDAVVDAHLFNFKSRINDDLSLAFAPGLQNNQNGIPSVPSFNISLTFIKQR